MKKKILITAYDIDPMRGSESTTGWNIPLNIDANKFDITVITRLNNLPNIEKKKAELGLEINFLGYDLPKYLSFWKKGSRGAMLYFYLWQISVPYFISKSKIKFDLVHSLNFHCDYVPHFLWVFGKPNIWGPVNHHESIPFQFIPKNFSNINLLVKGVAKKTIKLMFYNLDPFLYLCKKNTSHIFVANKSSQVRLRPRCGSFSYLSQIGSDDLSKRNVGKKTGSLNGGFKFSFMGRLVPLKGVDLVIEAFAMLMASLDKDKNNGVKLIFIGDGELRSYITHHCKLHNISDCVEITGWLDRDTALNFLSVSDVFVFPSHEGGGLVLSESASLGIPVISLDNDGAGSILSAQSSIKISVITRKQVVNDLAVAMEMVLSDVSRREKLSEHIKYEYLEHMSWASKGCQISKVYEQLLNN